MPVRIGAVGLPGHLRPCPRRRFLLACDQRRKNRRHRPKQLRRFRHSRAPRAVERNAAPAQKIHRSPNMRAASELFIPIHNCTNSRFCVGVQGNSATYNFCASRLKIVNLPVHGHVARGYLLRQAGHKIDERIHHLAKVRDGHYALGLESNLVFHRPLLRRLPRHCRFMIAAPVDHRRSATCTSVACREQIVPHLETCAAIVGFSVI